MSRKAWVLELLVPIAILAIAAAVLGPLTHDAITPEGWLGITITAFVAYLYADHAARTITVYARRGGSARLREVMLALLLGAGMLGILMGVVARYVPEVAEVARFARWVTLGMLAVGGLTTWITWRLDDSDG